MPNVSNAAHSRPHTKRPVRVSVVLQDESSECGLACIAMILGAYGHYISLSELRDKCGSSQVGITLSRLISISESLNLAVQAVQLGSSGLPRLHMPCVLHWNFDHFVVLVSAERRGIVIHDPAIGRVFVPWYDVVRRFTGVALEAIPGSDFVSRRLQPRLSIADLVGRVKGIQSTVWRVVAVALLLEAISLALPLMTQLTVDSAIPSNDSGLLEVASAGFLCLLVMQAALSWIRTSTVLQLGATVSLRWSSELFEHLMRLPSTYFSKRQLGDILGRFHAVGVVQDMMTSRVVDVALDGMTVLITLGALVIYSPRLAILSMVGLVLYGAVRLASYRYVRQASVNVVRTDAIRQDLLVESLRANQTIRLHNAVQRHSDRFRCEATRFLDASLVVQRATSLFVAVSSLIQGSQRVATFWVGGLLVIGHRLSVGMLIAYVFYSAQFAERASRLLDFFIDFQMLRIQVERLADIELAKPEKFAHGGGVGLCQAPAIEFKDVSFFYGHGEKRILERVSFRIEAGECVAIVGPSGCGKSTIARLMLGLLDAAEGVILINGIPIEEFGKGSLRGISSTVLQEDCLLSGSIAENIHFFDDAPNMEGVFAAARLACIHDEVEIFPMRYQTHVGSLGSALSSGQQQRVLIARALYREPGLLILDEATSHLDVENEKHINLALQRLSMTRVVIAHRPQTISAASRVIRVADAAFSVDPAHEENSI